MFSSLSFEILHCYTVFEWLFPLNMVSFLFKPWNSPEFTSTALLHMTVDPGEVEMSYLIIAPLNYLINKLGAFIIYFRSYWTS